MKALGNDRLFQKQMVSIGLCMLLQEILFLIPAYAFSLFLYPVFDAALSEVNAYVVESLLDGASYMCAFFIPSLVLRKSVVPKQSIPYRPAGTKNVFLYVPAAAALIFVFSILNSVMLPAFYLDFSNSVLWDDAAQTNLQLVLSFITTALVPGICEEFLFRGAVQTSLRPFGRRIAVVGSALLFGLMHANAGQFFYAFCAGIILGLLREKTGSLWPGMLVHIFNNALSVIEGALSERLAPEAADMVLYAVEATIFALGLVCLLVLYRRSLAERERMKDANEEGNFGIILPSAPQYTEFPTEGNVLRLSVNVPMIFFLLVSVGRAILYLVWAYFGVY